MQPTADATPIGRDCADERRCRQTTAQSVRRQRDAFAFDNPRIGLDRIPPCDHRGTIIVAGAWLAFYVITAIHHFISSGN